ncbi:MAG: GNAT family N-acetyltransferase [Pseudomonadota bacterium]|nr:GNAT family N-acetyltransferase [Pseudomonadota bacterium]
MSDSFTIGPAAPEDIPAIRAIESDRRYKGLVGSWPAARHRREMALRSSRYFVLRAADGAVAGFALLQGFGDPDLKVHLKRIAVREPGSGLGSMLLSGVLDRIYSETDVNRIDLDVFCGNDRARSAYEKAGFKVEGVLREYHRNSDGGFSDMWLMSVLRRDRELSPS